MLQIDGQAITSIADMQWALHNLPNTDTTVSVQGSETGQHTLKLAAGWKQSDISWRGSMWSLPPNLGMWMPPATEQQLRANGLKDDEIALFLKWINGNAAGGRAAKKAGLREGDLIVELDGKPLQLTNRQFSAHVKLNYKVGDKVSLTVLRNGKRRQVALELVE